MIEEPLESVPAEIDDFYGKEIFTSSVLVLEECPECGMNSVTRNGRCKTCQFCGWSACSM